MHAQELNKSARVGDLTCQVTLRPTETLAAAPLLLLLGSIDVVFRAYAYEYGHVGVPSLHTSETLMCQKIYRLGGFGIHTADEGTHKLNSNMHSTPNTGAERVPN